MASSASLLMAVAWGDEAVFEDHVRQQTPGMANPHFDILVVTVIASEPGPFTEDEPPRGVVRVDEVLRGTEKPGTTYAIQWRSTEPPEYASPSRFQGGASTAPGGLKGDWVRRPVAAPSIGDRFIVFDAGVTQKGRVSAQETFRLSAVNRDFVLANMAPPERRGAVQNLAILLILVAPAACLWLHARSRSLRVTEKQNSRARIALAMTAAAAIVTYAFYESGVSAHSNIRVDLLMIWPALLLTVAITAISLLRFAIRQLSRH